MSYLTHYPRAALALFAFLGAFAHAANYSNQDLSGTVFTSTTLSGSNFTNCDLSRATFDRVIAAKAVFTGATFSGATISGADMTGSNFTNGNLAGATIIGTNMSGANFKNARFQGTNFREVNLQKSVFTGATLSGAVFNQVDLRGTNLSGAIGTSSASFINYIDQGGYLTNFTDVSTRIRAHATIPARIAEADVCFHTLKIEEAASLYVTNNKTVTMKNPGGTTYLNMDLSPKTKIIVESGSTMVLGPTLYFHFQAKTLSASTKEFVLIETKAGGSLISSANLGNIYFPSPNPGAGEISTQWKLQIVNNNLVLMRIPPPTAVAPLTSVLLFDGGANQISVKATADKSIVYAWEVYNPATKKWTFSKRGTVDEPEATLTLDINAADFVKGIKYRCYVWNGSDKSDTPQVAVSKDIAVTLCARTTVDFAKTHNPHAFSQAEYPGLALANYKAVFAVTAKGTAIKYQWESTTDGTTWKAIDKAVAATYTTPILTPEDFNKTYRCAVTNTAGTEYSDDITITKMQMAELEGNGLPSDIICANTGIAEFTVTPTALSGNPAKLTYKWEVSSNGGATWKAAGATQTLKVSKPAVTLSGNQYRCTVSNAATPKNNPPSSAISRAATLVVRAQAVISAQPKAAIGYEGGAVTYTVTAKGYELQYQWEFYDPKTKEWVTINGATIATLSFGVNKYPAGAKVRCKVWSNGIGNIVTTSAVGWTVRAAVGITQASYQQTYAGSAAADFTSIDKTVDCFVEYPATLTVKATGYAPKYQWYRSINGGTAQAIAKATAATYKLTKDDLVKGNTVQYHCKVYNDGGELPTGALTVKMLASPAPTSLTGTQFFLDVSAPQMYLRYRLRILATSATACTIIDDDNRYDFLRNTTYSYKRTDPWTVTVSLTALTVDGYSVSAQGNVVFDPNYDPDYPYPETTFGAFTGTIKYKQGSYVITSSAQGRMTAISADSAPKSLGLNNELSLYLDNDYGSGDKWAQKVRVTISHGNKCSVELYPDNATVFTDHYAAYTYAKKGPNVAVMTVKFNVQSKAYNLSNIVVAFDETGSGGVYRATGTIAGKACKAVGGIEFWEGYTYTGGSGTSLGGYSHGSSVSTLLPDGTVSGLNVPDLLGSDMIYLTDGMIWMSAGNYSGWTLFVGPISSSNAFDAIQLDAVECLNGGKPVTGVMNTFEVSADEDIILQVNAAGADLQYKWYVSEDGENWAELAGATESSCYVCPANGNETVSYRCEVSNGANNATTEDVTLIIRTDASAD